MNLRIRIEAVIGVALLACTAGVYAADDPFVGTWKVNKDKSQVTGQREEIKDLGGNKYEFIFGDVTQTIVADGTDQPNKFGGTWAMKRDGPDKWTQTVKHDGKVISTSTWTLSDSGNQFTAETKGTRPDGSEYTESFTAKRVSGGPGLVGTWESTGGEFSATEWVIKPYGTDGLSFAAPAEKEHQEIKFDGKDYPDHGPRVTPGSTSTAKRIDEHTIEMTDKIKGKVMDTQDLKVSDDGKTMVMTIHNPGVEKPTVFVWEKQ
jgi:hypothetical protein